MNETQNAGPSPAIVHPQFPDAASMRLDSMSDGVLLSSETPEIIAQDVFAVQQILAIPTLLEVLCEITGMGFAAVARVTEDSWTACAVKDTISFGLSPGNQLDVKSTLCIESIRSGVPIVIEHASLDPRYCNHPTPKLYKIESHVSVPIALASGRYFGNLCAIDPAPAKVSAEMLNMFQQFATLIGMQLDHEMLREGAQRALRAETAEKLAALERLEVITSNAPGYVFQRVLKPDGSISYDYLSPSLFRILGLPEDTDWSRGQNFAWFLPSDKENFLRLTRQSAADMTQLRCDIRVLSAAGAPIWFRTDSTPRRLPNGDTVWEGLALDVTAEKVAQAELQFVSQHDVLTGLPNRFFFRNAVVEALSRPVGPARIIALFYIDLCSFGAVNDKWGEARADKLLRRIALTLTEFAETMGGTVTRVRGDEFGLLLPNLPPNSPAMDVCQLICAEVSRPMVIDGTSMVIEACVGAADTSTDKTEFPDSAEVRGAELTKRVRLAISAAKRDGAGACVLYSPVIADAAANRLATRDSLRAAIESEQFELHYQPLVDLKSGSIIGAEALVRWSHPDQGLIRPDIFIPIAEATRLIVPLGGWITAAVMRQVQAWRRLGLSVPCVSINLSNVQLQSTAFLDMVEGALAETGSDAADFEFELTEGILIDLSPEVCARLSHLKALGFAIALDDFGSGHATFAYLRQFPVDKIKIDQMFVRHLVADSTDALIVKAMINMAFSLGLDVLAEGIETKRQRDFLIEEGCRSGQGYLYSKPLNSEDFAWMLEQRVSLPLIAQDGTQQSQAAML